MQKKYFSVLGTDQEFWIDPDAISGQGDAISPYLRIPLYLKLLPTDNKTEFILTDIDATLIFEGFSYATSKIHTICNIDVLIRDGKILPTEQPVTLEFPLDQNKVAIIEKNRKKDAHFSLSLIFRYGIYTPSNTNDNKPWNKRFISQFNAHFDNLFGCSIGRDNWITNILPALSYKSFRLIEVPSENLLVPNEYKNSLIELDQAKEFLLSGYPDKVVAHCRGALDPFKDKIKGLTKNISNPNEANWIERMTVDTNVWLDSILRATKKLTSDTHHSPSIGHFDKTEAEIIYIITVGIIGYIGRISSIN